MYIQHSLIMSIKHLLTFIFIGTFMTVTLTFCSPRSEKNDRYLSRSGCKFEDGIYSAIVDYYNSGTGYSQTYTLDVEVQDCEVVQIYFPNGGWLDRDHITPAELDEDGTCIVYGEDGKSYEIQIDN